MLLRVLLKHHLQRYPQYRVTTFSELLKTSRNLFPILLSWAKPLIPVIQNRYVRSSFLIWTLQKIRLKSSHNRFLKSSLRTWIAVRLCACEQLKNQKIRLNKISYFRASNSETCEQFYLIVYIFCFFLLTHFFCYERRNNASAKSTE